MGYSIVNYLYTLSLVVSARNVSVDIAFEHCPDCNRSVLTMHFVHTDPKFPIEALSILLLTENCLQLME